MWGGAWDVRRFDVIDSTNAYLVAEARPDGPDGLVAVADYQTAGRGRLDRRWEAPNGASLLASFLLRPSCANEELHLCTAAVALAAAEACAVVAAVHPALKWPNDLLVGEAKLAGVLAEVVLTGARPAVVVGLGLNVAWPGPDGVGGTCLNDLSPEPVDRVALLDALLAALSPRRTQLDTATGRRVLAAELRACCATLGQRVRVVLAGDILIGTAEAVDDTGRLIVRTATGMRTVSAGDVVHLRPAAPADAPRDVPHTGRDGSSG
jgi:BirA family biotin operon repressor/biotin-[acetyl-CoA-carboxylase] ligase